MKLKLNKKKTGQVIKEVIHESSYTIEEIANELDFTSPRVIYEWIKGNKLPSLESLVNLSKLLNIDIIRLIAIDNLEVK